MELGLTIPLIRHLKRKDITYGAVSADRFYCWDLHIITLKGRNSLLAVHCTSRFTFVLWDVNAVDWDDLISFSVSGIRQSLLKAGLDSQLVSLYFDLAGQTVLTKTHGRREVAFLNRAWDDVIALELLLDQEHQFQLALNDAVNDLPRRCAGCSDLHPSAENLQNEFKARLPK